jgi:hypothetical protein
MTTSGTHNHGQDSACNSNGESQPRTDKPDPQCRARKHGTAAAYRRGCRCDIARKAIARYEKQRHLERLNGHTRTLANTGAMRRLHALRALGWPSRELAKRIGVDERNIARWEHRHWITRSHYNAVCRVYTELSDTNGPDTRARRHAERQGWLPPIWWDLDLIDDPHYDPLMLTFKDEFTNDFIDPIALERGLAGDRTVHLTRTEKTVAVKQLHDTGRTLSQISQHLHMSGSSVREYLARAENCPAIVSPDHDAEPMHHATEEAS